MLADTRILCRDGAFTVLHERQPIIFPDRSGAYLHRVRRNGVDETYLRAMPYEGVHWCVFDLRQVAPTIGEDFRLLLGRDHPGVILYTLRSLFPTNAEFIALAFKNFVHVWTAADAEPLLILGDGPALDRLVFQPELKAAA